MKHYIIHDLHYSTYYCGSKSATGFCSDRSKAYVFYGVQEAKAAVKALKDADWQGNKGCIYEEK